MNTSLKKLSIYILSTFILFAAGCDSGGSDSGSSGPQNIVIFGDSISSDFNYPGTPPWPQIIQSMKPEWTIVNRARGSERIAAARGKAASSITDSTNVVVVLIGSVNVITSDTGGYANDLRAIIQLGKAKGAKVVVGTIPPMVGGRIGFASAVDRLNQTIRDVVSSEGATLVNIFGELDGDPALFPDGLHPNLDGQRIIAVAMREKI
jgi:lysophospholipase L1-like esterase